MQTVSHLICRTGHSFLTDEGSQVRGGKLTRLRVADCVAREGDAGRGEALPGAEQALKGLRAEDCLSIALLIATRATHPSSILEGGPGPLHITVPPHTEVTQLMSGRGATESNQSSTGFLFCY